MDNVRLTGKHLRQVHHMGAVGDHDTETSLLVRLAMVTNGENPFDSKRAAELLELPLSEYSAYAGNALEQMGEGPEPVYEADGTAHVGDFTLRKLKGADLMRLGSKTALEMAVDMLGVSLDDEDIGVVLRLSEAVSFLAEVSL